MFGLDPLSRPVAIIEILILLGLAAFIGWLLGRLILAGRIKALQGAVADKEAELAECRRTKALRPTPPGTPKPTFVPTRTYVPADPLEPALSFDDTPDLVTVLPTDEPVILPPVEIPPLGAPIPEAAPVLPPTPGVGNSEADVLTRIAARAGELNFDRIGRATATEADDLKDIVGIGPFLERKLHSLGIYTFRQVGNFTKEDIDKVNEIIEFFPGRIERDNWVDQAREFHKRKYGSA